MVEMKSERPPFRNGYKQKKTKNWIHNTVQADKEEEDDINLSIIVDLNNGIIRFASPSI